MQDLIKKIEELKKALGAMKPKSAQQSLVPAIKPPTVKPLSMPSASIGSAKKPKLPGVTPPTNKDPKAMAAQLKNPKPKAPKIEVMKTDKNGQWSLDKANEPTIPPKDESSELTPEEIKDAAGAGKIRIANTYAELKGEGHEYRLD